MTYEHDRALMEGARNSACDDYFSARPQIDTIDRRRVYEAGFQAGAASRDAEIQRLQMALADAEALELGTAERCDQLRVQISKLRDAFQTFIDEHEECQDADEWMAELCSMEALHVAGEALATTPEQSIAEYRNKVIEECASVCDKRSMRKNDGNWTDFEWDSICGTNELAADEIRAMKDQP